METNVTTQEIHPSISCSRNLRRRTGVWLGVEAMELLIILCLSLIPDILYRIGFLQKPNLLLGILISGSALGFVVLFKRNKPPNYFTLWLYHHLLHPKGWRATNGNLKLFPIINGDKASINFNSNFPDCDIELGD